MAVLPSPRVGRLTAAARSKLPTVLWIASGLFVIYGTTIPFNFVSSREAVLAHLSRVTWNPLISPDTGQRVSIPDVSGNVLLFVPFGCLGMWALTRPRSSVARIVALALASAVLSAGVEILQLATVDRISSVADVGANTVGGLIGAIFGWLAGASAEGFVAASVEAGIATTTAFYPLILAAILVLAGAWEPFDATLDVGSVVPKLRAFIGDPLQLRAPSDEGMSFLQHLLFSSTLALVLQEVRVAAAGAWAAAVGVAVAVGAEACQLFIGARMPGLWDAFIGAAGAIAGARIGLAAWWSGRTGPWRTALATMTVIAVAMQQLTPFTIGSAARSFQWVPFLNYYAFTTSETVSHTTELLLAYFPLGFAMAMTRKRRPGTRRVALGLGAALAIAVPVEWLQQYVGGRYPDVTDVALSVAGAALGGWCATRGWELFDRQVALMAATPPRAVQHEA